MKFKFREILIFCIVAFIFSIIPCMPVLAQDNPPASKKKKVRQKSKHQDRMKFTEEQKQKLKSIKQKYGNKLEDLHFKTLKKRIELVEEIRKDNPDRKKVDKIVGELNNIWTQKQKIIIYEFFEIRNILTPEQKKLYVRRFTRQLLRMQKGAR